MKVVIIGAGRWSIEVLEVLQARGHEVIGWLDDRAELQGQTQLGAPVLGPVGSMKSCVPHGVGIHVAIGNPEVRLRCLNAAVAAGIMLVNAIHPSAVVMPSVKMGDGNFIGPCAVVSSGSTVGNGVVVHMGCTIGHHSTLEDGAFLGSGVHTGGGIVVGRGAFVCPGVTMVASVKIGAGAVVSSGIAVAQDVPPNHCLSRLHSHGLIMTEGNIDWPRVVSGMVD